MPGWQRIALVPGLELHLHASVGEEVRALAQRVVREIRGQ
jgi:hypothetical protein